MFETLFGMFGTFGKLGTFGTFLDSREQCYQPTQVLTALPTVLVFPCLMVKSRYARTHGARFVHSHSFEIVTVTLILQKNADAHLS